MHASAQRFSVVITFVVSSFGMAKGTACAVEIERVLQDLQSNEDQYKNIDVVWNENYRLGKMKRKLGQMIDFKLRLAARFYSKICIGSNARV